MTPRWDDLQTLWAVLETGSLSRAAKRLHTSQPTVGRRLDRLAESVGSPLIERRATGCVPTPLGRSMQPALREMFAASERIDQVLAAHESELRGVVRIAAGDLVSRRLIPCLPDLLEDSPGLRVEFLSGLPFVNLQRGEADLAIRTTVPDGEDWVTRVLPPTRFAVFASASFLARRPIHPTALWADGPWISFPAGSSARSRAWLVARLCRDPEIGLTNSALILDAANQGLGMALLPEYAAQLEPTLQQLTAPVEGLELASNLVTHPSARRLARVRVVAERLARWMQRTSPSTSPQEPAPTPRHG